MRFCLKTHTFHLFSPSVHTNTIKNGGVRLQKRRFSETLSGVEAFENDYVTGIGMSQFHLHVKSINNRSNMAGYLALMLFTLISTLIACLELNSALINLYTLILRKRQSLVTKTDVFLSVFGGQVWTVENAAKSFYLFSRNRKRRF